MSSWTKHKLVSEASFNKYIGHEIKTVFTENIDYSIESLRNCDVGWYPKENIPEFY